MCTCNQSNNCWNHLFRFPTHCLRVPKGGGHRRSLASYVNVAIRQESDPHPSPPWPIAHIMCQSRPWRPEWQPKLEEGDFKDVLWIASSVESFAPDNAQILAAIRSKHPPPHPNSNMPLKPVDHPPCLHVSSEGCPEPSRSSLVVQQGAQMAFGRKISRT